MEKIYCIGDSHVSFFSGHDTIQPLWPKQSKDKIPLFQTFRIGATLAHSLSAYGSRSKGREILFTLIDRAEEKAIPEKSKILMCFGEIDCRAHLLKRSRKEGIDIDTVVRQAVKNYHDVLTEIQRYGHEVFVWNIVPSGFRENIESAEFPTFGTSRERNDVTRLYNLLLEDMCSKSNKIFLNILNVLLTNQNETLPEFYMDDIHLSQKAMPFALEAIGKHINIPTARRNRFRDILKKVNL